MQAHHLQTEYGNIHLTQQTVNLPPTSPDPAEQLAFYLQTVNDLCRSLPLGPLDPGGRESARVTLEQVYVGLDSQPPLAVAFEKQKAAARSALAYVAAYPRLVILGDPGSGKSTFLRFLALRLAQARLEPQVDWLAQLGWPVYGEKRDEEARLRGEEDKPLGQMPWPHPPFVPVLVTLRDFAATAFDPASPLAVWDFVAADLTRRGLAEAVEAVRAALVRGEALLLLDGVDEVPAGRRAQVWQAIGALGQGAFNRCRWLATCRVLSYVEEEAAAAAARARLTLAPLTPAQIETFIAAWYHALTELGEKTPAQSEALAAQLRTAAAGTLVELAPNPMLLTIMALVQSYYGTLPDERAKLYQACVETLLLRWQQNKETVPGAGSLPPSLAQLGIKQEAIEPLLWEIGYTAHAGQAERQGAADIPETQVMELAKKHLGDWAKAEAFVEYTERRAHLLVGLGGRDDRRFSFPHRTFQEYLAGCHLANDRRFGRRAIPLAQAGPPWREALLLAAGTLVFNQKVARNLFDALEDLLPEQPPAPGDTPGWQQAWRAAEMLAVAGPTAAEADEVGRELWPRARELMATLLTNGELTPPERAEAGQALAVLGDPRPGVTELPPLLTAVLVGEFLYGEANERRSVAPFQAGVYPITNAQYAQFIAAGGYERQEWWSKAGWQWRQGEPAYSWQKLDRPDFWEDNRWNRANQPVVGITWYEAEAFCNWLSAVYDRLYRLPTETEWERLARGQEGRVYPWGDDWQEDRANTSESRINQTSAVGLFPGGVSPARAYDCSGNVWEWCADWYDKSETDRVLRGGSWSGNRIIARCAIRNWYDPYSCDNDFGLRVVSPTS
ncbi:MAG: SUMF1/EgtB/PvdO family nonheme iron enzyme [Anaerolineae bacterium]|nr:SUMF1/EgtB/PvdO family nonheme iron enzyme [Anaerolineae bacterium]